MTKFLIIIACFIEKKIIILTLITTMRNSIDKITLMYSYVNYKNTFK